jgi:hypothetical protein
MDHIIPWEQVSKTGERNKHFNHKIFSSWVIIKHGVPQESVLGIFFFFI